MSKTVHVGVVGAGIAAEFHLAAYRRVSGYSVEIAGITSRTPSKAAALAEQFGIQRLYPDLSSLLSDREIDVVDLCVPVHLHCSMAIQAAKAGKDVVCEKPLLGFAGNGRTGSVPRGEMFSAVQDELEAVEAAFRASGTKLLYAENWVYAPAFRRIAQMAESCGGKILEIRGNEAHSGSASPFSMKWETSGGGSLLRLGIHPLSAAIYLKQREGIVKQGYPYRVRSAWAQMSDLTRVDGFDPATTRLVSGWVDVENWAVGVLTFDDNSVAVIHSSDISLGGVSSWMELYTTNARLRCNIHPNDTCISYSPDPRPFDGLFLNEKLETKAGWNYPSVDHNWEAGYVQEIEDFVASVAEDREPLSGLELALESIRAAYALYMSAEEGVRVDL
ncbi:MAG TPA: Gfo/Idh/MocA family oxidoreductase [Chloroflexota bacterium]|nr:Gfo/Idh/MocA family oxidoreductase [Chloroflexota bacterium]